MPAFCCVVDCGNRRERDNVKFFRIPAETHFKHKIYLNELSRSRRQKWLSAIKRQDWTETKLKNSTVCSKHFLSGESAQLEDVNNPDWVPSLAMGYGDSLEVGRDKGKKALERKARVENRSMNTVLIDNPEPAIEDVVEEEGHPEFSENDKSTQTDITAEDFSQLIISLESTKRLQKKLDAIELSYESLKNDDVKTKYYTGLDTFKKLERVMKVLEVCIIIHFNSSLLPFQQVLLTLVKLRLNLDFKDLAYRFNVSPTTASNYFHITLKLMYDRFRKIIIWPTRENLQKTMPSCFIKSFNRKITVIIDCFEIFIEKPSNLLTAAQCWSHYKHHNTAKFLIGVTPQGLVCFISQGWGGRASDKHIVQHSTFLNNLTPGDIVLADRGFTINEYVRLFNAELKIPAFTKGKSQLHPREIEETRAIANVRIHVERVIGIIKQKYRILTDTMPISLLSAGDAEEGPIVDKVVLVCCALVNMCPSIVPQ